MTVRTSSISSLVASLKTLLDNATSEIEVSTPMLVVFMVLSGGNLVTWVMRSLVETVVMVIVAPSSSVVSASIVVSSRIVVSFSIGGASGVGLSSGIKVGGGSDGSSNAVVSAGVSVRATVEPFSSTNTIVVES